MKESEYLFLCCRSRFHKCSVSVLPLCRTHPAQSCPPTKTVLLVTVSSDISDEATFATQGSSYLPKRCILYIVPSLTLLYLSSLVPWNITGPLVACLFCVYLGESHAQVDTYNIYIIYKFIFKLLERKGAYERQERGSETPGISIVLCSPVCLIRIRFDQVVTCDSIKFNCWIWLWLSYWSQRRVSDLVFSVFTY